MMCTATTGCPGADDPRCDQACVVADHPEQGWQRLCNGVIRFDDGGCVRPDGTIAKDALIGR